MSNVIDLTARKITEIDIGFVKEYLKVDYDDEDNLIENLIVGAKSYVDTMLGYKVKERFEDKADIPQELTIACLMIISHWYDHRQIQTTGTLGDEIKYAVTAIIDAHRDHVKTGLI